VNSENKELKDIQKKYNINLTDSLDDILKLVNELKELSKENKQADKIVSNILAELDIAHKKLKDIEEE
tara:strand:- start:433 stop:636 length:204 start_codon:yes stop_codon:yes gene_type:complete